MKILIDCRFATKSVGLGRYTRELVSALLTADTSLHYELIVAPNNSQWLPNDCKPMLHVMHSAHYSLGEQFEYRKILQRVQPDVLFVPHFNIPLYTNVPIVCTIHDLILHHFPNQASLLKRLAYRFLMHRTIRSARAIIAVSQYTKKDILHTYGQHLEPNIHVVTESVPTIFAPATPEYSHEVCQKFAISTPYFLYVGNNKTHKNVPFLLEAFLQANVAATLVLVCNDESLQARFKEHPALRFITQINDLSLAALYTSAIAFVTASLYEGFCLPIIEARACRCPIMATNRTAIPELARNDTILLEPALAEYSAAFKVMLTKPKVTALQDQPNWQTIAHQTELILQSI